MRAYRARVSARARRSGLHYLFLHSRTLHVSLLHISVPHGGGGINIGRRLDVALLDHVWFRPKHAVTSDGLGIVVVQIVRGTVVRPAAWVISHGFGPPERSRPTATVWFAK